MMANTFSFIHKYNVAAPIASAVSVSWYALLLEWLKANVGLINFGLNIYRTFAEDIERIGSMNWCNYFTNSFGANPSNG